MDGFIAVLKPPGVTSHDVVARLRRRYGRAVGHAGTLDPDAVGVLVVALGAALKLLAWANLEPKRYWGRLQAGTATATGDAAGAVVGRSFSPWPTAAAWVRAAGWMVGTYPQVPPVWSARRVRGRRAYAEARAGRVLWLEPKPVSIAALRVLAVDGPAVEFEATVGGGTYVRAMVRDWAEALGHAGHLVALIRTAVGPFTLQEAVPVERALDDPGVVQSWRTAWMRPVVTVSAKDVRRIATGRFPLEAAVPADGPFALQDAAGRLVAVAEAPGRWAHVLVTPDTAGPGVAHAKE
jgi:tRNA pseudouridine55 synthase